MVTAIFALAVALIAFARRSQIGARSLFALMLVTAWWVIGTTFEYAALDFNTKIFWAKIEYAGVTTAPVFFLYFALEYTRHETWFVYRRRPILFIVPLIDLILVWTNEWHHWIWTSITPSPADPTHLIYGHGIGFWIGVAGYSYLMLLSGIGILTRSVILFPKVYRSQAIVVIGGALLPWVGNLLYVAGYSPAFGMDLTPLLIVVMGAIFAWAVFRHNWFDLVPVARSAVIDSMTDAILVINAQERLVDLNPAAQKLLGVTVTHVIGQPLDQVCAHWQPLLDALHDPMLTQAEMNLPVEGGIANYHLRLSALHDTRHNLTGRVIMLRDVTLIKQAQQAMHQAAILAERDQMARELHDNLGQVLSYLAINAHAIRDQIEQGNYAAALGQLDALGLAAQSANRDMREYILDIKTQSDQTRSFTAVLKNYLARFETITGLNVELSLPAESIDAVLPAPTYLNLLRIIQEALANARKHAHAAQAHIVFTLTPDQVQIVIADDGKGFDPLKTNEGFGLGIMKERAAQANAQFEIRSAPDQGTQVILNFARVKVDAIREQLADTTVLLADDHPLFIEGIKNLLTGRGLNVLGVARDGEQAICLASQYQPDLILVDVQMPKLTGVQALPAIKQASPRTRVVMLSMSADDDALVQAISQGASGFLLKSQPPEEFFNALVAIQRGETTLAPGLMTQLAAQLAKPNQSPLELARQQLQDNGLSVQQIDILTDVARGLMYKEIAAKQHISESAIKYHVERILTLLNFQNRSEAIAHAFKLGLVQDRRNDQPDA